jgi:hypothetical protein
MRRRRCQPPSCEDLEPRQLLAHATIAPAAVTHSAALVAGLAPAASRKPALDTAVETLFLEGVERQVVGITPSTALVAPYLKMLQDGVPRVRVLERLLKAPAAQDETVTDAYARLLRRDPSSAEGRAMATKLDRGGDLRTLLVALASSSEYYVGAGGGNAVDFRNALRADLLGVTTPIHTPTGKTESLGPRARATIARALVYSRSFNDRFLQAVATQIGGASEPGRALLAQARNALRGRGGMTRALAILLASHPARDHLATTERQLQLAASRPPRPSVPTAGPPPGDSNQAQMMIVPTDFGGALDFNPVSYEDTFSGQSAPTVALPMGLINQAADATQAVRQATYELWFNAQTNGALLQMQLSGNGQTFDVPILAVDANGKLTGGLFDVDAGGQLSPGMAGSVSTSSTADTTASVAIAATLPSTMTSPLTLDYATISANNDNPYTYQVVGANNAMVGAANMMDRSWHHAALVVDGNSENLYLDGLLVGAAQAVDHYSLGFTDAQGNAYAPTEAGFLGGTVDPLPISAAAQPPGTGYPAGFVGALGEFRVWTTARTTAQIDQAMDAPLVLDPAPPGLIGYYDFSQDSLANRAPNSPFGPATTDADATGTRLSASYIVAVPSTIPADPFDGVPRLPGYQNFAPYLAVPYSNFAPSNLDLGNPANPLEYKVTLAVGDTVIVEVPGAQQNVAGPFQVDFLGFTTYPEGSPNPGSHPVMISYPKLEPISQDESITDYVSNNMAAAFIAPASGTYLIRIAGPSQNNGDNSAVELQFSVLPGNSNSLLTLIGTQTVQGGGGTTVPTYTDPAALPGATIEQLVAASDPGIDPGVLAEVSTAYGAFVAAAKFLLTSKVSFTDFLDINTGVDLPLDQLFGLQDRAYTAVINDTLTYLGTNTPSTDLEDALKEVQTYLDGLDSERHGVYNFLVAQDSWIDDELFNIIGSDTIHTVASDIVNNQQSKAPYLEPPPPQTPSDIGAQVGIQVGQQVLGFLTTVLAPLIFPKAQVVTSIVGELLNLGATVGATFGEDALNNTASQMPRLVVPPNMDDVAALDDAATYYQTQLVNGLRAHDNLANTPGFLYPLLSNVGLLRALGNLNELVLDTQNSDNQLGPSNPTTAAVTYSAWKVLLPSYFKWRPVDPTTESQSQNFDNFFPGATPESPGDAANQLEAMQSGAPYPYSGYWEADRITFDDPSAPTDNTQNNPQAVGLYGLYFRNYAPTSMANVAADTASGGADSHAERFFTLMAADLSESATVSYGSKDLEEPDYLWEVWQTNSPGDYFYNYRRDGLYVSGWELVDANGVEIDPRTAVKVFPVRSATTPVTDGPAFLPYGGAWYENLTLPPPPTPPQGSDNIQESWLNVFSDWFHQSSFVTQTLSGTLNIGQNATEGLNNDGLGDVHAIRPNNPDFAVSFYPINNPPPPSFPSDQIVDRGFEHLQVGNGNFESDPSDPPWSFANSAGIAANGSGYTGGNPPAPDGTQVAYLQEKGSSICQSVVWAAGSYQLSFEAAQRMRGGNFQTAQQDFNVLIDGNEVVGTFTPSGTTYQSYTTAVFTVTAGSHTITFQGLDSAGGDNTAFIDQIVASPVAAGPPLIPDHDFDQLSVGTGGYVYDPTGSAWTFSPQNGNSGSGISANNSAFTSLNPPAPQGNQVAFLRGTGSFSQSVAGWSAGSYQLSFQAAQRARESDSNYQLAQQDFEVLVDGTVVGTFTPAGTSYQTYTTAPFTVTSGDHTITFQGLDSAGGDNTAFIDQVVVEEAAAPPSIADQDFELISVGPGGSTYDPTGSFWTFTPKNGDSGSGVAADGSAVTAGNPSAPGGVQVAFLQGTGAISQSVDDWAAGSYQLSFEAAQQANVPSPKDFQLLVDGSVVGTFQPSGTSYQDYTTAPFTLSPGDHTITFQGVDNGGDNAALIDRVVVSPVVSGPPAIPDRGFEQVQVLGGGTLPGPVGSAWTFSAPSDISGNSSQFTAKGNPPAPQGTQVAGIGEGGSISQSVAGWAAGTYQLSFQAAQGSLNQASQQDFEVLVDGTVVGTFTPAGTSYQTYTTAPFTVTSGDHTITFQGLDSASVDDTALIDAITLTSVAPVADPGFEQFSVGAGQSKADPGGSPWNFLGTAGIAANDSGLVVGNPPAPQGIQVAYLEGNGSFSQEVPGWAPGTYQLSFSDAQAASNPSQQDFEVLIDGVPVAFATGDTITPGSTSYRTDTTAPFTISNPGSHTITFQGLDSAGGDNTAFIDRVVVQGGQSVPIAARGLEQVSVRPGAAPVLTSQTYDTVVAHVRQVMSNLVRTHDTARALHRVTHLSARVPFESRQLAAAWMRDLASYDPRVPGSGRATEKLLLAELNRDVAAGVAAGAIRVTGRRAPVFSRPGWGTPQSRLDSVRIADKPRASAWTSPSS